MLLFSRWPNLWPLSATTSSSSHSRQQHVPGHAYSDCILPFLQNRSQKEVEKNIPVEEARLSEKAFFEQHEAFGPCMKANASLFGVQSLTNKLTHILSSLIAESLPGMYSELKSHVRTTREGLDKIGNLVPDDDEGRLLALNSMIFHGLA
jgi:hypothetical protein